MNKYYEVIATINGASDVLYGSFERADCVSEIDAERDAWKIQGYKAIKIAYRTVIESPDAEVYPALDYREEITLEELREEQRALKISKAEPVRLRAINAFFRDLAKLTTPRSAK
jgi:hypothetical protein